MSKLQILGDFSFSHYFAKSLQKSLLHPRLNVTEPTSTLLNESKLNSLTFLNSMSSNIQNQECILGINANGHSLNIATLTISDDQSRYDCICNVSSASYSNGNGSFTISLTSRNQTKGLSIGNWLLFEGRISYDWGQSTSRFILLDEFGDETNEIRGSFGKGSCSGFSIESLTRSIFTKAREIISDYPTAKIYNAYSNFLAQKPNKSSLKKFVDSENTMEAIKKFEESTLKPLHQYINSYNNLIQLLMSNEDPRSKHLIRRASKECRSVLEAFAR